MRARVCVASLFLDLLWRKVQGVEPSFLVYRKKPSDKLDTRAPGFAVWSDWPDLNDLHSWSHVALEWVGPDSEAVIVSAEIIADPNISVRATINIRGTEHELSSTNSFQPYNNIRVNTGLSLNCKGSLLISQLPTTLSLMQCFRECMSE